jgi:hypothetical protein
MRRLTLLFLIVVMIISLAACGAEPVADSVTPSATPYEADDLVQPPTIQNGVS